MTDKTILQRYAGRGGEPPTTGGDLAEVDSTDDLGAFGWLRGMRERAVMLELRKKDGNILAVGYGYLEKAEFNPSEGITLSIAGHKVRIEGRSLNAPTGNGVRLFEGIARHRVPWVQEADEPTQMETDDNSTVIDRIRW
jgi:hypothetical protein